MAKEPSKAALGFTCDPITLSLTSTQGGQTLFTPGADMPFQVAAEIQTGSGSTSYPSYTGTIQFTTSGPAAPANIFNPVTGAPEMTYIFSPKNNGVAQFGAATPANGVAEGSLTITATDASNPEITGSLSFLVSSLPEVTSVDGYSISGVPAMVQGQTVDVQGGSFLVAGGSTSAYGGTVTIGSLNVSPTGANWTNTDITFQLPTSAPLGSQQLTVTNAAGQASTSVFVTVYPPISVSLTAPDLPSPKPWTAPGKSIELVVTAMYSGAQYNQFQGSVSFSTTDPNGSFPANDFPFDAGAMGQQGASVTLQNIGDQIISATLTFANDVTGAPSFTSNPPLTVTVSDPPSIMSASTPGKASPTIQQGQTVTVSGSGLLTANGLPTQFTGQPTTVTLGGTSQNPNPGSVSNTSFTFPLSSTFPLGQTNLIVTNSAGQSSNTLQVNVVAAPTGRTQGAFAPCSLSNSSTSSDGNFTLAYSNAGSTGEEFSIDAKAGGSVVPDVQLGKSYSVEWVDGLDAVYGGSDNYIGSPGSWLPIVIANTQGHGWFQFALSGQNPPQTLCSPDSTIMLIISQDLTTSTNTDVLMPDLKYGNSAPNVCTVGSYPAQISAAVTSGGAVTICGGQGSPPTYSSSSNTYVCQSGAMLCPYSVPP